VSEDLIKNHPISQTIKSLRVGLVLEKLDVTTVVNDVSVFWVKKRITRFLDLIESHLAVEQSLVSVHGLNQLQAAFRSIHSQVTAYQSNRDAQHLYQANIYFDQSVLPLMWAVPTLTPKQAIAALTKSSEEMARQVQVLLAATQKEAIGTTEQLSRLEKELTSGQERLDGLKAEIVQQKAEGAATSAEVRKEYAQTEQELRKDFAALLSTSNNQHSLSVASLQESNLEFFSQTEKRAKQFVEELELKRDEAAKIVQIVGNIGVTGNYQRVAAQESDAADTWRKITLALFAVSIGVVIWALYSYSGPADWHTALVRVASAIALAAPALYTSKESARHRTNADTARRAELELASLGPFLETLPPEMRSQIREKLADKYFGQKVERHEITEPVSPKDFVKFAEHAITTIKSK
jgi:hypothetical protein